MKDLVVLCINIQEDENIKKNYGKINVTSFSLFCDLDLDFLKVIADSMPYYFKTVSYTLYFKL